MRIVLAFRNLWHDRVRFAVTLAGIVFAVVLITIQLGLFIGFAETTSSLIDHARADIWIGARGVQDVDQTVPFDDHKQYRVLGLDGVGATEPYIAQFAPWNAVGNAPETVIVVGFDPDTGVAAPWNVVAGSVADLKLPDTVMIDELYAGKLGVKRLGQVVEINGHHARVVAFTRGIRSFTQSPYVFATLKSARKYLDLPSHHADYILVTLRPDADPTAVRNAIASRLDNMAVLTKAEFSRRTRLYWMITTGAGLAVLVAAVMGLLVGSVVVAQTLYATTIDHLKEFATLRAIGAAGRYIYAIILWQAAISAALGYGVGLALATLATHVAKDAGPAIPMPWPLAVMVGILTLVMCAGAAVISIRKVMRVDPVAVFR
ncbi:MAG TPA: ABC transporter permease [Alphaproteobacteria bacterium]|nr:ABC transporter permease [Alphaproteobacteria bacterium]